MMFIAFGSPLTRISGFPDWDGPNQFDIQAKVELVVAKNGPKNLHPSEQEGGSMAPSGARLIFKGYTMRELAEFLSMMPAVARPVGDMTGIDGRFDFTLDVLGPNSESDGGAKRAMMDWQTLISDVQDQFGLRFESTKTQIDRESDQRPRRKTAARYGMTGINL